MNQFPEDIENFLIEDDFGKKIFECLNKYYSKTIKDVYAKKQKLIIEIKHLKIEMEELKCTEPTEVVHLHNQLKKQREEFEEMLEEGFAEAYEIVAELRNENKELKDKIKDLEESCEDGRRTAETGYAQAYEMLANLQKENKKLQDKVAEQELFRQSVVNKNRKCMTDERPVRE